LHPKVFRSARDDGETPNTIALSIGITSNERHDHVVGLTMTTVNGGGRTGRGVASTSCRRPIDRTACSELPY
jgi:hypothetical protein